MTKLADDIGFDIAATSHAVQLLAVGSTRWWSTMRFCSSQEKCTTRTQGAAIQSGMRYLIAFYCMITCRCFVVLVKKKKNFIVIELFDICVEWVLLFFFLIHWASCNEQRYSDWMQIHCSVYIYMNSMMENGLLEWKKKYLPLDKSSDYYREINLVFRLAHWSYWIQWPYIDTGNSISCFECPPL